MHRLRRAARRVPSRPRRKDRRCCLSPGSPWWRRGVSAPVQRRVPVPDGLDGERLDAAIARMFGLSRTRAAELISAGAVLVGGAPGGKSDRVPAGEWLEVTLPPAAPVQAAPQPQ